jgi:hypothetical protein
MNDPDNLHDALARTLQQIKGEMARLQACLEALKKQIAKLDVQPPLPGSGGRNSDSASSGKPDGHGQ